MGSTVCWLAARSASIIYTSYGCKATWGVIPTPQSLSKIALRMHAEVNNFTSVTRGEKHVGVIEPDLRGLEAGPIV